MMANFKKALANKGFVVGGCIFLAIALIALIGPLVWTVDPNAQEMTLRLSAPSPAHPFGCDDFGRDLLARVIAGARVSLGVGIAVTLATSALGLVIGAYACYNERLDHILMRICDGLMSIPGVLLAIALMAMMGASVWNVIIALSIVYTPSMARIVRSRAMVVKEEPFVEALRVQGASTAYRAQRYGTLPGAGDLRLCRGRALGGRAFLFGTGHQGTRCQLGQHPAGGQERDAQSLVDDLLPGYRHHRERAFAEPCRRRPARRPRP